MRKNNYILLFIVLFLIMPIRVFAYTLSFDSNGGSGTMADRTDKSYYFFSTDVTNSFTAPEGKVFVGWSLTSNGVLITNINMTSDKTVYAIWKTPITEASAMITAPVGGVLPDIHPVSGNSSKYSTGGQASLTDAQWSTDFNSYVEFNTSNTFVTGTDYTLYMAFRAADGYCFTDDTVFKINGKVATEFSTTGNSNFIRGEKVKFTALNSSLKSTINVVINDHLTTNRGKFSIANDTNSNNPESTSLLSVDLIKNSNAILYVTPELDYSIEKILVDGNEVSFSYDYSVFGVNKPYKAIINMDTNKNVVIYFKLRKTLFYNLSEVKMNTATDVVASTINKQQYINQKKTEFINEINNFKVGKSNVTSLSDAVIDSLFTDNKYAVITDIKYVDSSFNSSSNLVAIGFLSDWDNLQVAQGWVERTSNYEIEYTEYTLSESNPQTGDAISLNIILVIISMISFICCGLFMKKYKFN